MKTCKELIDRIPIKQIIGNVEIPIHAVCFDSREVLANTLFVAQKGNTVDGHDYITKRLPKEPAALF